MRDKKLITESNEPPFWLALALIFCVSLIGGAFGPSVADLTRYRRAMTRAYDFALWFVIGGSLGLFGFHAVQTYVASCGAC